MELTQKCIYGTMLIAFFWGAVGNRKTNTQYIWGELFPYYSANVIYCQLEINQRANTLVKFSIIDQYFRLPLTLEF